MNKNTESENVLPVFDKRFVPGKASTDATIRRRKRIDFIGSLIFISLGIVIILSISILSILTLTFSMNIVLVIMITWFLISVVVGLIYPYWSSHIIIENNRVLIQNRSKILFPYYTPYTEFDYVSPLTISVSKKYDIMNFKQGNKREIISIKGLDEKEIQNILIFLRTKENIQLTEITS